jgi:hypothetical protein
MIDAPFFCLSPSNRAVYLKDRLSPSILLHALNAAIPPHPPFVTLIGIKAMISKRIEFKDVYFPTFKNEVETDPEIIALVAPFKQMGFTFGWEEYSEPSGIEQCLAIYRNQQAEERLKEIVEHGSGSRLGGGEQGL